MKHLEHRLAIYEAFKQSTSEEGLVIRGHLFADIIAKLPKEDKDWLRTMYKSKLDALRDEKKPNDALKDKYKGGEDVVSREGCNDKCKPQASQL